MKSRFGRRVHQSPLPGRRSKYATNFEVESYLAHQGQKFVDRFDAISYLAIMRMMDTFDLPADYGSVAAAFAGVRSKFLIVSISSDWLFPPEQQLEIVTALIGQRKEVSYFQIQSDYGHDAFLLEYGVLNKGVRSFLEGRLPKHAPASVDRLDLERISPMIPPGTHLLDVGSGDGGLMVALARAKGITGVCLDREFEMVTDCMHRGLSAIQLDADTGMEMLPDNAFDCVLVNQTIQQLRSALGALRQLLRLAPTGVIGFPNFAYYEHRLALARDGRLPKSRSLPYEWYDSPNIHVVTIADFRDLCDHNQIRIEAIEYISDTDLGKQLIASGDPNLGAERAVVRIARGAGLAHLGGDSGQAAAATLSDDAPPVLHDSAT